jgi:hypothetical protein
MNDIARKHFEKAYKIPQDIIWSEYQNRYISEHRRINEERVVNDKWNQFRYAWNVCADYHKNNT